MRYITLDIIRPRQERWFWEANEISLRLNIRLLIRIKLILIRINKIGARDLIFPLIYIFILWVRKRYATSPLLGKKKRMLPFLHFVKIFHHDNNVFSTLFLGKAFALRCIYIKLKDMNKNWIYLRYIMPLWQRSTTRPQAVCSFPPKAHPIPVLS